MTIPVPLKIGSRSIARRDFSHTHTVVPRSLLSRLVGCMKWAGRGDQHFNFEAGIFRDLDLGLGFVEGLYCILFSRLKGKMRFENKRLV